MNQDHPLLQMMRANQPVVAGFHNDTFGWNPFKDARHIIAGIGGALDDILKGTFQTIGNVIAGIVKVIGEVVKGIGSIAKAAFLELNKFIKFAADLHVKIIEFQMHLLKTIPIVKDVFKLLDQYTGGLLTNIQNAIKLPFRALRGDAIKPIEVVKAILTVIQVVVLVFGGPVAIGAWLGYRGGVVFCDKQKMSANAKSACKAAFAVAGAAIGGSIGADVAAGEVAGDAAAEAAQAQARKELASRVCANQSDKLACRIIVEAGLDYAETDDSLYEVVTDGLNTYVRDRITQEILKRIIPPKKIVSGSKRIVYVNSPIDAPAGIPVVDLRDDTGLFMLLAAGVTGAILAFS